MPLPTRAYDRTLNAELERLIGQISVIKQDAEGLLHGLSDAQFNWSPGDGQWSIAQCIDHLNVSNRQFSKLLEDGVARGRAAGQLSDGPYSYSFLSRAFLRLNEPPVKRKFKAPGAFRPSSGPLSPERVVPDFFALHDRLIEIIQSANGLDLAAIKVPSPVTRLLKFNLGMMFWILAAHDRRHLWQVRQIRGNPGFPN